MGNLLLKAALEYRNKFNFSLIPFRNDKTAYLDTWKEFQQRIPTEKEIIGWWTQWPNAIIALVCGKINNLFLVDFDLYKQKNETLLNVALSLIPTENPGPIANTPSGGFHRYFKMPEGVVVPNSKSDELCIDIKGEGGLAFVPPSTNGNGNAYAWHTGRSINEVPLESLSIIIYNNILKAFTNYKQTTYNYIYKGDVMPPKSDEIGQHNIPYQSVTKHNINLDEGSRDESLFHIANCLVRGGMELVNIEKCLGIVASQCNPPFPERELYSKISSAIQRARTKERSLTEEIRQFVGITNGFFSVTDACQSITFHNKPQVRVILHRMTTGKTPILEKDQKRDGWFRRIDSEVQSIDWLNTESEEIRVEFPFGISRLVKILPKNIIVVAGAMDAGKTAFLLNFVAKNSDRFKGRMHYFSSEMGPLELKTRLEKFPGQLEYWKDKFYFYERSSNFADMIKPDDINIIDYLELSGAEGSEFTKAGYFIRQIFDKLNNGIALIAIQKKRGIDLGRGAELTAEKARLYLSLDSGKVKIVKAKNWRTSDNPNNKYKTYKLVDGCKIQEITKDWIKED